jgi:hypothetical protein
MLVNPGGNGLSEIGKAFVEGGSGSKGEDTGEATDKISDVSAEKREIKATDGGPETKRFFWRAEAAIMKVKNLAKRKYITCMKCRGFDCGGPSA